MGVLFRVFVFLTLVSCDSGSVCLKGENSTDKVKQHVSLFSADIRKRSRDAAVEIMSYNSAGRQISGSGAYIVYKQQHFILTAAHVVSASPVAMIKNDGETILGNVAFVDEDTDVALVSIEGMFTRTPIVWSVSKKHKIGSEVYYTGYPNTYALLTIEGKIAGYDRGMTIIHSYVWRGASGSAVLDKKGKIVGVVSAVDVGTDVIGMPTIIEDVGIVVPVHKVEEFLKSR
jgi:S1-C subfamily serine protease